MSFAARLFTGRRQASIFSTCEANVALKASTENAPIGPVDVEPGRVLLLPFRILCNTVGKCSICLVLKSTLELSGKVILSRILRESQQAILVICILNHP